MYGKVKSVLVNLTIITGLVADIVLADYFIQKLIQTEVKPVMELSCSPK